MRPDAISPDRTQILLVEDNPLDARATIRALAGLAVSAEIEHRSDGAEALNSLNESVQSGSMPDLILLDLNASGVRGLDVLDAVMTNPTLRHIAVAILSTSDHHNDIDAALARGALAYLIKPHALDGWADIITTLDAIVAGATLPQPSSDVPEHGERTQ